MTSETGQLRATAEWLVGGGEMGAAIRAFDWSRTPLGPRSLWPQSLRVALGLVLNSRFSMFLWWGTHRINLYNDAYVPMLGKKHPASLGQSAEECWREIWPIVGPQAQAVFERGESSWNERLPLTLQRYGYDEETWFTYSYSPVFDEGNVAGMACVATEETAHVLAERRQALLMEMSDKPRTLSNSSEMVSEIVNLLGSHLKASRVGYGQVQPDDATISLESNYVDGSTPLTGIFPLNGFGDVNIARQRQGLTVVFDDVRGDLPENHAMWASVDVGAFVSVPLVRDGKFRASLFVNQAIARRWLPHEISLIEEVAARIWDTLERVRAEEEVRKSEERLTFAFEAGGGIGTWDYNIRADRLTCGERFARFFSVERTLAATGLSLSSLLHAIHHDDRAGVAEKVQHAIAIGGQYAAEYRVVQADGSLRWALARGRGELSAAGTPTRFIGVVFDITERKVVQRRDTFLVGLDDAVRPLTDAHEITQTAARLLGRHLEVNRCAYADVDEDEDTFNLTGDYNNGVESIVGRYRFAQFGQECLRLMREGSPFIVSDSESDPRTEGVRSSYRATAIRAVTCVPMRKQGRFVAAMAVHQLTPRQWQPDEIDLVQQVASRCWESIERARIARELAEREERYRFLAESIPQMVWTATPEGGLDYVSSQVLRYFDADADEVLGQSWLQWVHPDDIEGTTNLWKRSLETGTQYEVSFRLLRASDSTWRWHLVRAQPLFGDDDAVVQWFGTCTDIEDQKRAEAHLKQQWHTFDTALSHTPDFTYIFDLEGRFTYVNRALLTLWQKPLEEALGKNFSELSYPAELAARLQRQIRQVIETREPVRDHTPFTGPDGVVRQYEYIFVPVFAGDGSVQAVGGSTRDITERARIEQALARSEEKLQQVFAEAPVAIAVFRGRDYVFELANAKFKDLLQKRELVGRRFRDAVPELDDLIFDAFAAVMDTGQPFIGSDLLIPYDQDGDGVVEEHWFNVMYHPLRDAEGPVTGIVAVCSEVTVQVRSRRELERVNRELEEFAYVASHDMQEPLRMVNIYTHLILKQLPASNGVLAEYGSFVQGGVTRMEMLIRDLLTFSRTIHSETLPVGIAYLPASADDAIAVLKSRIDESAAVITIGDLPSVRGDTQQLAQVFQNLIGNALKYRSNDRTPVIDISARQDGRCWIVSVQDNGIGFEQQYAERIFGLFKRLHKDEYPGTGLGLAICQRIVQRYGGGMWANSSPGKGATFFISLPAAD